MKVDGNWFNERTVKPIPEFSQIVREQRGARSLAKNKKTKNLLISSFIAIYYVCDWI